MKKRQHVCTGTGTVAYGNCDWLMYLYSLRQKRNLDRGMIEVDAAAVSHATFSPPPTDPRRTFVTKIASSPWSQHLYDLNSLHIYKWR